MVSGVFLLKRIISPTLSVHTTHKPLLGSRSSPSIWNIWGTGESASFSLAMLQKFAAPWNEMRLFTLVIYPVIVLMARPVCITHLQNSGALWFGRCKKHDCRAILSYKHLIEWIWLCWIACALLSCGTAELYFCFQMVKFVSSTPLKYE